MEVHRTGDRTDVRKDYPDRIHKHSRVPSPGKNGYIYSIMHDSYKQLPPLPSSYDAEDKNWMFRYLRSFLCISPRHRSYIWRPQCIAVIFNQPQIMTVTKFTNSFQIKWISQCMCDHNCFCFFRPGFFQHCYINVILRNRHVYKNRNRTILDHRRYCCRESGCYCDNFISAFNSCGLAKSEGKSMP